ncbi:MAG: sugar phosphate isomerase/epimerase family protein [Promethearchaeota archaeon]
MKISICNEIFQSIDFEEICVIVKKIGYDGIEIAPYTFSKDVRYINKSERNKIKNIANSYNLQISAMHWLLTTPRGLSITSLDTKIFTSTFEYFKALIDFANDLEIPTLVLGSPQQRNIPSSSVSIFNKARKRAIHLLKSIGNYIEEINNKIKIGFEPLSPNVTNFGASIEETLNILKEISHPNIKINLDANQMTIEDKSPEELINLVISELGLDGILHIHINEPNMLGPGMKKKNAQVFSTICDRIIKKLKLIGYKRWISVESFDRSISGEIIAKESIKFIRKVLNSD